tara:strand:- start:1809 stop:2435 length:627 start_codon:yes stop_codon:yes gene_type:complete
MDKAKFIEQTFEKISELTDDNFVTIRNFHHIPHESSMENDIDVLIPRDYIADINAALKETGCNINVDNLQYLYGAEPHIHYIKDSVHFDVVTGLYYRSSNDLNIFVKINDELTDSMMKNKVKSDNIWKWQPSPEDELVHLCCHAIFDKRLVKDIYSDRIDFLFKSCDENKVKWLLKKAFYKVSETIFDDIKNYKTKEIYKSYVSFIDY